MPSILLQKLKIINIIIKPLKYIYQNKVIKSFGIETEKLIFPAATDSRFLRKIGIPSLGFSPMRN